MFYSIYTASHWESFIDALANKDFLWIKGKVRKFNKLLILLACSYFVLYLLEEEIINFWVGTKNLTNIKTLSPFIIAYFLISSITNNYIYIINSYGKLRIQLIAYILISLINIPLSIYFVNHTSLSSEGVILASSICLSALMILMPLQYYKIVNNKSKGIWGK
jgi:O-antigen/teichoic acid export membrane protein